MQIINVIKLPWTEANNEGYLHETGAIVLTGGERNLILHLCHEYSTVAV